MSGGIGGMFWRFLVAADRDVDRFIIRDSDSRLNPRERCAIATECLSDCLSECLTKCHEPRSTVRRLAVEEWIASGKRMHSIRDPNPNPNPNLNPNPNPNPNPSPNPNPNPNPNPSR